MLESKRQEPTDHLTSAEAAIPPCVPGCLLRLIIPPTNDEHQSRHCAGFKDTDTHAACQQGPIAGGSRRAGGCDSPKHDVYSEVFARWKLGQNETWISKRTSISFAFFSSAISGLLTRWQLRNQVGNKEESCGVGELVSLKPQVLIHSHGRRILVGMSMGCLSISLCTTHVECYFVKEIEKIDGDRDGENSPVNLAP